MKTQILTATLLMMCLTACNTYYRMTTVVSPNGQVRKNIYTRGDSAFLSGDKSHNPFLFNLDSGWEIEPCEQDTSRNYNVKVTKQGYLAEDFSNPVPTEDYMRPLAVPQESMNKRFKWFYTYYTFTSRYLQLTEKGPIPISNYLDSTEIKLWFRGDLHDYPGITGMNGVELNGILDRIADKFNKWYSNSMYEISFEIVQSVANTSANPLAMRLPEIKDTLYTLISKKEVDEISPAKICQYLDNYFGTSDFSSIEKEHKKRIDSMYDEKTRLVNLFGISMDYELVMPGVVVAANTPFKNQDTLVWKVDAYRIFTGDYVLTAESRTPNLWSFIVTALLIAVSTGCFIKVFRRRKRS
ncbi:MAG: hypothetical protein LBM08_07330 [Dysgonamonadaceae bacterium]|jgi:hypothetical protein|nr:hypothetical protein [Dysgonamonadaceae bacterium]